jgi:hypothetical protein
VTAVGVVTVCADCLSTMEAILLEASQPSRPAKKRPRELTSDLRCCAACGRATCSTRLQLSSGVR